MKTVSITDFDYARKVVVERFPHLKHVKLPRPFATNALRLAIADVRAVKILADIAGGAKIESDKEE